MLNFALCYGSSSNISDALLKESNFLPALVHMIEHNQIVIRGKSLLTFLLLFKQDFRWMAVVASEINFFHVLDKVVKDTFKYV